MSLSHYKFHSDCLDHIGLLLWCGNRHQRLMLYSMQAGYSLEEVSESGASREDLVASGFSDDPKAQPTSLLRTAFSPGCDINVTALHAIGRGTASSTWRQILKS